MLRRSCKLWVGAGLVCALTLMITPAAADFPDLPTDEDLETAAAALDSVFAPGEDLNQDGVTNSEQMALVRDIIGDEPHPYHAAVRDGYEINHNLLETEVADEQFAPAFRIFGAWLLWGDPIFVAVLNEIDDSIYPAIEEDVVVVRSAFVSVVPNVEGQKQEDAEAALAAEDLEVSIVEEFSDTVIWGRVINQDPAGGEEAPKGGTVTIAVSVGPQPEPHHPVDAPVGGVVGFGALAGLLALGGAAVLLRRQKK